MRYKREKSSFEKEEKGKRGEHRNQGGINGRRKEWEENKEVTLSKGRNYEGLYSFKGW